MLPEPIRFRAFALAGLVTGLFVAVPTARAEDPETVHPLQVSVEESEQQTVVHVRDPGGELTEPKIALSHSGFMLSFEGEFVERGHERTNAWRLGRVQTAQYGDRAVVRLIQRKGRPGPIDDHTQVIEVDGGLDIVVVDKVIVPTPSADAAPTQGVAATTDGPAQVPSTADTVAALQDELGPVDADEITATAEDTVTDDLPVADEAPVLPIEVPAPEAEIEAEAAPFGDAASESEVDGAAAGVPFGDSASADAGGPPLNFAAWTLIPSILALFGMGLWMKKRKATLGGSALEVVAKTSLGPKQQIVQVKVDGRELLLGVTEHQIGLITEVASSSPAASSTDALANVLASASRPRQTSTARSATPPPSNAGTHHEFGSPAPVTDRSEEPQNPRIEAFKARLASALKREVASNDTAEETMERAAAGEGPASDLGELRRLLGRRTGSDDPAWAREDVA